MADPQTEAPDEHQERRARNLAGFAARNACLAEEATRDLSDGHRTRKAALKARDAALAKCTARGT